MSRLELCEGKMAKHTVILTTQQLKLNKVLFFSFVDFIPVNRDVDALISPFYIKT